jgi:hypothetical protein
MLEKLMEHIGQQEIDEAKKTKEEKPEAEKEAEKHAEKHAKGRRASTPMANGGTDRPRDRLEGTHSFWPQRIPSNVSQVPLTNEEKAHVVEAKTISDEVQEFTAQSAARRYLPCHYFDYICGSSTGA